MLNNMVDGAMDSAKDSIVSQCQSKYQTWFRTPGYFGDAGKDGDTGDTKQMIYRHDPKWHKLRQPFEQCYFQPNQGVKLRNGSDTKFLNIRDYQNLVPRELRREYKFGSGGADLTFKNAA